MMVPWCSHAQQPHLLSLRTITYGWILWLLSDLTDATPVVAFPFNAQVPPLPLTDTAYSSQFNPGTFTSTDTNESLYYTIQNGPEWLQISPTNLTLYGTPSHEDLGSNTAQISATDSSGTVTAPLTLIVVEAGTQPVAISNITAGLSHSSIDGNPAAPGSELASPTTLALYTSSSFNVTFDANETFSGADTALWYAAISSDRSPLPSWVHFHVEGTSLRFSGVAPPLVTWPQTFGIRLTTSTVKGFEGAAIQFEIEVSAHQLVVADTQMHVSFQSGQIVDTGSLLDMIVLDGLPISSEDIKQASALGTPSWLAFNSTNLGFRGLAPSATTSFNLALQVSDKYGDSAEIELSFIASDGSIPPGNQPSLFSGSIGTIYTIIGAWNQYTFDPSLFSQRDVRVEVDLGSMSPWLSFSPANKTMSGYIPSSAKVANYTASMTVTSASSSDTQLFQIAVVSESGSPRSALPPGASESSSSSTGAHSAVVNGHSSSVVGGALAAAIVIPILLVVLATFVACFCWKRRQLRRKLSTGKLNRPPFFRHSKSLPFMCAGAATHDRAQNVLHTSEAGLLGTHRFQSHQTPAKSQPDMEQTSRALAPQIDQPLEGIAGTLHSEEFGARDLSSDELAIPGGQARVSDESSTLRQHMPHDSMKLSRKIARKSLPPNHSLPDISTADLKLGPATTRGPKRRPISGLGHGRVNTRSWSRLRFGSIGRIEESLYSELNSLSERPFESGKAVGLLPAAEITDKRPRAKRRLREDEKLRSVRLIDHRENDLLDTRPLDIRRQSYISRRASNSSRPLFSAENRQSRNSSFSIMPPSTRRSSNRKSSTASTAKNYTTEALQPSTVSISRQYPRVVGDTSYASMWTNATSDGTPHDLHFPSAAVESVPQIPRRFRDALNPPTAAGQAERRGRQRLRRPASMDSAFSFDFPERPSTGADRPDSPTIDPRYLAPQRGILERLSGEIEDEVGLDGDGLKKVKSKAFV